MLQSKLHLFVILIFLSFITYSCTDNDDNVNPPTPEQGDFTLEAKYDSIRAYPGGGGIFIVYINPNNDFEGDVGLKIEADTKLNAELNKTSIDNTNRVAEIEIKPDDNIDIKNYNIILTATHDGVTKKIVLDVKMYNWGPCDTDEAFRQLDKFKSWLISQNSKYSAIFENPEYIYLTYPEILIVEHYTFLFGDYEVRLCRHVMIEPHDWSKICIRKRGNVDAELAATRGSDGIITEMDISEYPLFGY